MDKRSRLTIYIESLRAVLEINDVGQGSEPVAWPDDDDDDDDRMCVYMCVCVALGPDNYSQNQ